MNRFSADAGLAERSITKAARSSICLLHWSVLFSVNVAVEIPRRRPTYGVVDLAAERFSVTSARGVMDRTTYSRSLPSASGTRRSILSL